MFTTIIPLTKEQCLLKQSKIAPGIYRGKILDAFDHQSSAGNATICIEVEVSALEIQVILRSYLQTNPDSKMSWQLRHLYEAIKLEEEYMTGKLSLEHLLEKEMLVEITVSKKDGRSQINNFIPIPESDGINTEKDFDDALGF